MAISVATADSGGGGEGGGGAGDRLKLDFSHLGVEGAGDDEGAGAGRTVRLAAADNDSLSEFLRGQGVELDEDEREVRDALLASVGKDSTKSA
jgi:hypothetical protein